MALAVAVAGRSCQVSKPGPEVTVRDLVQAAKQGNRELVFERFAAWIAGALHEPRARRPTKPTAAARKRRLADKRHAAQRKLGRRPPSAEGET